MGPETHDIVEKAALACDCVQQLLFNLVQEVGEPDHALGAPLTGRLNVPKPNTRARAPRGGRMYGRSRMR